jgi:hypothetical protein
MLIAFSAPRLTVMLPSAGGAASLAAGSGPDVQSGWMSAAAQDHRRSKRGRLCQLCRDLAVTSGIRAPDGV